MLAQNHLDRSTTLLNHYSYHYPCSLNTHVGRQKKKPEEPQMDMATAIVNSLSTPRASVNVKSLDGGSHPSHYGWLADQRPKVFSRSNASLYPLTA